MSSTIPTFGRMLRQLVDLEVLALRTEPLDVRIERRLKQFWADAICPHCDHQSIRVWDDLDRIWCRNCDFRPVYTYGTPFHEKHLSCGEVLLAYILYADTLLSISQIAVLVDRTYMTVDYAIRDVEAAISRGFPAVWARIQQTMLGPTEVDESGKVCSGYKGQDPPRESRYRGGSFRRGRIRWKGRHGDQLTLVAARRDELTVIRAKKGIRFESDLLSVIQETEDLSQWLGEVWTDGLQAYRRLDYDHRVVMHDERYVSPDGVHINHVESLWSVIHPWLRKFRGLSKQGLEQAAHTFGLLQSLNRVRAPILTLVDSVAIDSFHSST
ncbi:IS1595 family transposase [Natronorubrum halophilum]|uniref:IS1595 family transposase n=1 Tax=Natronorubrum halophilum TaxID=1702106 RepID=UPI000EF6529A|nr:IS1595 family transposase [Natronorubrum halophilum]